MRILLLLASASVSLAVAEPVTFLRDVAPILNKTSCTSGTCHGAAKGKNGFKLSLRGYDPQFDYEALLYDLGGRRFNRADPGRSAGRHAGGTGHRVTPKDQRVTASVFVAAVMRSRQIRDPESRIVLERVRDNLIEQGRRDADVVDDDLTA